jgi:signal transduction histidine kinase
MTGRNYLRVVGPVALSSLLLLGLCTAMAVYLYQQQSSTAETLGENIGSRRAAVNLEQSLTDLIALHHGHVGRVDPLHEQVRDQLAAIRELADKDEEKFYAAQLGTQFEHYLELWEAARGQSGPAAEQTLNIAVAVLQDEMLPLDHQLRHFNSLQIDESEQVHRRTLRRMAWGLAAVGVAGSVSGLLLGYVVARGLRRSIHRLQVRVRDAADKLGQDLPTVELSESGDLEKLHDQLQGLVKQIEQVVEQLQQREHEVLRAEQLAAVGQLAAGVAHEIRNPLTSIKLLVQAGREEAENVGQPTDDYLVIEREIRRMETSLQTFLDFARPPKLVRTPLDLAELVEQTLNLIRGRAAKQRVVLEVVQPRDPVRVEADGGQLRQVLVNLALNALDVMPHGGTLTVEMRGPEAGQVEVSVRDTGPGVRADLMPRLFEPFVSGKETGLGLGLVVSRRIVEDHGGRLTAHNRPEGGACFVFRLPVS